MSLVTSCHELIYGLSAYCPISIDAIHLSLSRPTRQLRISCEVLKNTSHPLEFTLHIFIPWSFDNPIKDAGSVKGPQQ